MSKTTKNNNINNDGGHKNNKKKGDGENKKEEKKPITVVFKIDLHCKGCASKIVERVRSLDGVETVKADMDANKLTVIGNVDPSKIREKLHHKLKKKVDLISPQPKKGDDDDNNNTIIKNDKKDSKPDEEKPKEEKETPVMTAVLKVSQHCQCEGCIDKIHKAVKKAKGWHDHSLDKENGLVTVKGMMMDVKALAEVLEKKLKRGVEVVSPKEEKDGNNGGGGGGGGNNSGRKKKGRVQKGESSGGGDDSNSDDGGGKKKKVICPEGESGGGGDDSNGGGGGGNKKKYVWQEGESSGGVGKGEGTKTKQSRCGYEIGGYQTIAYNALCHLLYIAISHTEPSQFTGNNP